MFVSIIFYCAHSPTSYDTALGIGKGINEFAIALEVVVGLQIPQEMYVSACTSFNSQQISSVKLSVLCDTGLIIWAYRKKDLITCGPHAQDM